MCVCVGIEAGHERTRNRRMIIINNSSSSTSTILITLHYLLCDNNKDKVGERKYSYNNNRERESVITII